MEFLTQNDNYALKTIGSAIFCLIFIYSFMPLMSLIGRFFSKIFEKGMAQLQEGHAAQSRMALLNKKDQ